MNNAQDPDYTIDELKAGNKRFLAGASVLSSEASLQKLKVFSQYGQFPKAIVLCCSDSRISVEMIFDQDIGDLFVIRVAGNIVAPSLVGSVEFAAATFGTRLLIVMGHTQCGAITATLNHIEKGEASASENIHDIVSRIRPHIFPIAQMDALSHEEKMSRAVEANVLASLSHISHSSRLIEGLLAEGKIKIVGAVFELSSGRVRFLDI